MILAIIQARMGSRRFPGKVLRELGSRPLLWHVHDRVRESERIDEVVIATSQSQEDISIIEFAEEFMVPVFIGSEDDVLDRFYHAADKFGGDEIVRICGDIPLIDPHIIDNTIDYFLNGSFDYVNNWLTFPEGQHVEILSFRVLEKAWKEATKPSEREHVTPFIYNNPQEFKIGQLRSDIGVPAMRLAVDYPCDFELVEKIYDRLWEGHIFYFDEICELFDAEPHLLEINKGIQKLEGYHRSLDKERANKDIH